jgi:hypothetical protein
MNPPLRAGQLLLLAIASCGGAVALEGAATRRELEAVSADCASALPDPPAHTEWARRGAGQAQCTQGYHMHEGAECALRCAAGYAQSTLGRYDFSCQGGVLHPAEPECASCASGLTTPDGRHCLEPLCRDPAADNHQDGAAIELAGNNTACEYSCEGLAAFFGVELATTDCFIDRDVGADERWPYRPRRFQATRYRTRYARSCAGTTQNLQGGSAMADLSTSWQALIGGRGTSISRPTARFGRWVRAERWPHVRTPPALCTRPVPAQTRLAV